MSANQLHAIIRHLRGIAGAGDRSDRQLLRQFASGGDQDAFAALVARHAPLVWGVCRRVLGHRQDAEDAFQATFFVLARKAGAVRWQSSVGGWLYMVAYRLAVRARLRAARRRLREGEAGRRPIADSSLRELGAVVDEELQRLPEKYRAPLLLHYLQGKTAEEAAAELDLSRGTFYNRLGRGRELLRGRLIRRGLTLSAPLLAAALTQEASAAPPALVQAALGATSGTAPERVMELMAGGLRQMASAKLKVVLVVVLTLGAAAGGAVPLARHFQAAAPENVPEDKGRPKADKERPPRVDRQGDPLPPGAIARLGTLRFRIDTDGVEELALAPDGKTLAVASPRGLWLFDAVNGKRTKAIRPPHTWFQRVAFSADDKRLMTFAYVRGNGPEKEVVQIWDVVGGRKISEVELGKVRWLGWSDKGQPLAACLDKGEVNLHETATGRKRRFRARDLPDALQINGWLGGPCPNFHCAVGKTVLAAGDEKGVVHVWNVDSGAERWTLKTGGVLTGGTFVNSLALSSDERWLASLSRDAADKSAVQLWDLKTGKATHVAVGDQRLLHSIAFTPDGKTLATVGWLEVRFWDAAGGRERGRTRGEGRTFAASVSFAPDGKTMAAVEMYCGAIHLWDVATGQRKPEPEGHSTSRPGAAFSPHGKRVATVGSLDDTIRTWDTATGRPLVQVRGSQSLTGCAFSADGRTLFSCQDDKLFLFDSTSGRELHALKLEDPDQPGTSQSGMHMYLSNDGKTLVALSHYQVRKAGGPFMREVLVTGWDTATRKQLFRRRRAHADFGIAVSADTKVLAAPQGGSGSSGPKEAAGMGPIWLEDLATGEHLGSLPGPKKGQTWPLSFSPDGHLLISITFSPAPPPASDDWGHTLRLWEVLTASELLALPTTDGNARVAFSPDGRLLAATASAGDILLWDLRRGKELHRFKGFDARVTSLAFSPDGRRLVSGLSDSTLLIWDVAAVRQVDRPAALDAEGAARAWADLAADPRKAFAARGALAQSPEQAVPLLKDRLRPARAADVQRLCRLLADLDGERFATREEARKGLEEMGELAEPALRQVLAGKPSLEVRRQIQGLLEKLRGPVTRPETLRSVRAVAVLEDIATPEARRVLERLAQGAPEARLTQEAKASLRRLALRRTRS